MKFSDKLRMLREEKGMSLSAFAHLLGTSKQVLSRYERGENTPKITTVKHYAEVLNVSLAFLANDDITDRNAPDLKDKKTPSVQLTEEEKILLDLFNRVPASKQSVVLEMIRLALKSQE